MNETRIGLLAAVIITTLFLSLLGAVTGAIGCERTVDTVRSCWIGDKVEVNLGPQR